MKLLKMGEPRCLTYSTAMLLGISPDEVLKELGHNRLEVHIQEIIHVCHRHGYLLVPIEIDPICTDGVRDFHVSYTVMQALQDYLWKFDAILAGYHRYNNTRHAVAWCHKTQRCYDPNGLIYPISKFILEEAWLKVVA